MKRNNEQIMTEREEQEREMMDRKYKMEKNEETVSYKIFNLNFFFAESQN